MPDILVINLTDYVNNKKNSISRSASNDLEVTDDNRRITVLDESNVTFIEIKGNAERSNMFSPSMSFTVSKQKNHRDKIVRKASLTPINKNLIFGTSELRLTQNDSHLSKFIECMTKYNANLPASSKDANNLSRANQALDEYKHYFNDVETKNGIIVSEYNPVINIVESLQSWFKSKSEAMTSFVQIGTDDNAFLVSVGNNINNINGSRSLAGILLSDVPSISKAFSGSKYRLRIRIRSNGTLQLVADVKIGISQMQQKNFNDKEFYPTGKLIN